MKNFEEIDEFANDFYAKKKNDSLVITVDGFKDGMCITTELVGVVKHPMDAAEICQFLYENKKLLFRMKKYDDVDYKLFLKAIYYDDGNLSETEFILIDNI